MRLSFRGGPWANRSIDSTVTTAPPVVAPIGEQLGEYRRAEPQPDSSVVVYEWSPDGVEAGGGTQSMRVRFALEVVGAVVALALAILTLFSRDWIETLLRVGPDQGSGELEWFVVFGLAAISIGLTLAARWQWRQLTTAA